MRTPTKQPCRDCGQTYMSTDSRDKQRCPRCRKLYQIELRERIYADTKKPQSIGACVVLRDPLEPGGFRPGVLFEGKVTRTMEKFGAFTDGTIVRSRNRQYYYCAEISQFREAKPEEQIQNRRDQ